MPPPLQSHIERYERYNRLPNEDEEADSEKQELVATLGEALDSCGRFCGLLLWCCFYFAC
jgi:putative methionine-R-sulfoxide reductase with GAF domain